MAFTSKLFQFDIIAQLGLVQVKEVDLYISCPACPGFKNKPTFWKHVKCGTRTTVTDQGYIACRNTRGGDRSCRDKKFVDCKWSCEEHKHCYLITNAAKYKAAGIARAVIELGTMLRKDDLTQEQYDTALEALKKIEQQL
mmetsp:Transcript_47047/g.75365  ORF Transcript_47047/g.75365 Transcript_47047/m.75365 type:complete len:140 (+) Transcript_47047:138-557(+)